MTIEKHEFPEDARDWIDPLAFVMYRQVRQATGCSMVPSPDPEALVRHDLSGSEHASQNMTRKSTAADFFLRAKQVSTFWVKAQSVATLAGFGLYFDTSLDGEPRPLAHLDSGAVGSSGRMLWVCPSKKRRADKEKREYIYMHHEPVRYLAILSAELADLVEVE